MNVKALLSSLTTMNILCVLFFIYCYSHIFHIVRKNRSVLIHPQGPQESQNQNNSGRKRERVLLKIMATVTLLFILSFLTGIIVSVLGNYVHISEYGYVLATMALYLSPACNFIIYGVSKRSFRHGIKKLLYCRCKLVMTPYVIEQRVVLQLQSSQTPVGTS